MGQHFSKVLASFINESFLLRTTCGIIHQNICLLLVFYSGPMERDKEDG